MNHTFTDQCLGCRLGLRLKETDEVRLDLLHRLVRNIWDMSAIANDADQAGYDILDDLIVETGEDVVAEYLGTQVPGTSTHH